MSLDDSLIPMRKAIIYFSIFFFWSFVNSANLPWSLCSKLVTEEDPECSQYMSAPLCWFSRPAQETGELEGHSRSALVPKGHCLDAGKDFPLVPSQSNSHVQQILCGDLGQLVHCVEASL